MPDLFDGKSLQSDRTRRSLQYRVRQVVHGFCLSAKLWKLSCIAYRRGWHPVAWALKLVNFIAFKAILPYECDIEDDLMLEHQGVGCAFSHTVTIGKRVKIGHHAALAAQNSRIVVEDDVTIGMHVCILGSDLGGIRKIGRGATIGAGAVVMTDVAAGATVLATPARTVRVTEPVMS